MIVANWESNSKDVGEELVRLRAEVEELKATTAKLYTDCEACKDKERDALREQVEELKKRALKDGEVRAIRECCGGQLAEVCDGDCKACSRSKLVEVKSE